MAKARILIVDDSAVIRRVLADKISADPDLEVAGEASNGRIALERAAELSSDLMILDAEMPVLDGLATLAQLRRPRPRLPVIIQVEIQPSLPMEHAPQGLAQGKECLVEARLTPLPRAGGSAAPSRTSPECAPPPTSEARRVIADAMGPSK